MSKSQKKSTKGKRPLQILYLPVDDGGCGWQRIRLFNEEFQMRKDVNSYLMDGKEDANEQVEMIKNADVVVGRLGDYQYFKIIKEDIDPSKPLVFDHDDNTMEVLPTSEHYREFGTEDAWIRNGDSLVPVWVTGLTDKFNRYKNLDGQMHLLYMLAAADMITAPVQNLLDYYIQFGNKNVRGEVILNCLNLDLFPEGEFIPKDKKEGEIRLGWEGGVSHMGDWHEIKEPLERVMAKYPEVTLYIHGSYYPHQFKAFKDRIIRGAWFPYRGYTFKIKAMGLDGAIIPLESKSFNEYKSELKFTEFSGLNIPCIVKDMLPYSRVIKDGENCWAFKTPEEFEEKVTEMIEDIKSGREKCNKFVKTANNWVKEERDIKKEAERVIGIYKSLLSEDTRRELL